MSGIKYGLGRFGDRRLEKGGRCYTVHWSSIRVAAFDDLVERERGRCSLPASCAIHR